ncbi:MAG: zinc ABC transporter solute-binding protein [Rhodobacteraceae bacterium]|nr:zinc ABC transporter solute-binding protein [Paracoccaceae bacterium]
MSRKLLTLSLTATLMGGTVFADAPRVAVDIAPVHSLVTRVMEGVGTPDLIIQAGASPHEYSLRPSEAAALQDANLVFWIGSGLTPWLTDTIETLAPNANVTELLEADGTIELEFREGALFEAHDDHKEDDDDHADEAHDDHEEESHDDHSDDDHDDEEAGHDEHEHGDHDPHAWLSPQNAMTWMNVIAGQLSAADPDNAGAYFTNAAAGRAEIKVLIGEVTATLDPVRDGRFIVFHDAYQYFETDFNFPASGAISISDASDPSPARIAEIQDRIAEQGIDCVLAEPQFNPGLVATVLEGSNAQTGILDPLGSDLKPGSALYPQLIRNLSTALAGCM